MTTGNNQPTLQPSHSFLPCVVGGRKWQISVLFPVLPHLSDYHRQELLLKKHRGGIALIKGSQTKKSLLGFFFAHQGLHSTTGCAELVLPSWWLFTTKTQDIHFLGCPEEKLQLSLVCGSQNIFLLTSHQMKIASHNITGKDAATSPVPHILLNVITRLQSSFHKSSGLPHSSFSQKE